MVRARLTPSSTTKSLPAPSILVNLTRNSEPVHEASPDEIDIGLTGFVHVTDILVALPFHASGEVPVEVELYPEAVREAGPRRVVRCARSLQLGFPDEKPPSRES